MKTNSKFIIVASLAVIVAVVVFYKNNETQVAQTQPKAEPVARIETPLAMPKAGGSNYKNTTAVVKKELPSNPYLTKESISSLPPTMKEFLLLDMKSIRSSEETKKFYGLLRSNSAIEDAQKILLSVKLDNLAESEREHLTATRFLSKALGDLNNKSNTSLNEIVKKIILKDNLTGSMPQKAKLVFAGDKAELVHTLIAFNQDAHLELLKRTKDANIKKIVENAYSYNQSMKTSNQ